jgi:cyclic beta-1,2-glucan synthetase
LTAAASPAAAEARGSVLEEAARALADGQRQVRRAGSTARRFFELPRFGPALDRAHKLFASQQGDDAALRKATEWFLDNYYLVRRVARQVGHELPHRFVRHLPQLATSPERGAPRIDVLARELVAQSGLELDQPALGRFVDAYQDVTPLTIAELWALPTMLRASVLSGLLAFLAELRGPGVQDRPPRPARPQRGAALAPAVGVERSIRALRLFAEIDWAKFFERHSRVEASLRRDPVRVYAGMDFDTCDAYRKSVEELAWATGVSEEDVAGQAIRLAQKGAPHPQRGHVGFYLVGEGRGDLEAQLGYRPRGLARLRRLILRAPVLTYFLPHVLFTAGLLLLVWHHLLRVGQGALGTAIVVLLWALPLWSVAASILQWLLAALLPPRRLPKLDYAKGIPDDARTLVVIPTLLGGSADVDAMLRQLELHYLANPDPSLRFALLTDHLDAIAPRTDEALVERAARGIDALNAKHGEGRAGPFHLLHRQPRWNPAEERFMGWERKRGKLDELNRLLRGDAKTSFVRRVGDPAQLERIRFVITLDSDTELPMGSAHRLIGLLAHPLNVTQLDERTGRVRTGYTVVQPRVETSPSSLLGTRFAQIFAGDTGFDIYTHATSEVYQDLFGSGIYCGKGIYDLDAFARSLRGRVPENALASHDLFEGVHGRAALASDIVLFEQYPSQYAAYSRRLHRWVRGDWQLLPWLLPQVPSASGRRLPNPLAAIDRWKIVDNVRRSLVGPCLCLALGVAWALPVAPLDATLITIGILLAPLVPALVHRHRFRENLARCVLAIVFLLHEAVVVLDAIGRVLVRKLFTHKHLLQWTSAANTALECERRSTRALLWREMALSPLLALAGALLLASLRPGAFGIAAPLLAAWMFAPEIAAWLSQAPQPSERPLAAVDRRRLRLLARRTWLFFETFVGPLDQWLPMDNHQEPPHEQTAHRTSPTNIGLMLLSTLAAYDLGYLGPRELAVRLQRAFDSIARMKHYQGHLLNWYDTKSLEPLLPQYVSTVDSGNLAGCLLALKQGCNAAAHGEVFRPEAWLGLTDSLELLDEILSSLDARVDSARLGAVGKTAMSALRSVLDRMRVSLQGQRDASMSAAYAALRALSEQDAAYLDRELLRLLETGAYRHEGDLLRGLRTAVDRLHQQLAQTRHEIEFLIPWLPLESEPATIALALPERVRLEDLAEAAQRLRVQLDEWEAAHRVGGGLPADLERSAARLRDAFASAARNATALRSELASLAGRADAEAHGMDFRLLYDGERKHFHIGYNVTLDLVDQHHYDLLASEARLASYLAIVKRDVPKSHWFALGRPMTRVAGAPALLSWGGTMFEYLMPSLLMRSRPGTLLEQSAELAIEAQRAYGEEHDAPWGISESAYARLDSHNTYQYRSFGVPGLGFKRELEDDLVITPYASMLALSHRPRAVVDNLLHLEQRGMLGTYGLFEALDLHPERAKEGESPAAGVVRSYMAHHQGMVLVALDNYLNGQIMVDRFHADASIRAGEMLLNERAPASPPAEWPLVETAAAPANDTAAIPLRPVLPWSPETDGRAQAFVLGNGRLASLLTDRGGGGLRWQGLALTRYEADGASTGDGLWVYVHDDESDRLWLATSDRGRTTFAAHRAEYHQRDEGLSVHVDVAVAPAADVELRQITLHNETERPRRVTVTSAGEPVLLGLGDAGAHPAFGRMFLESEHIAELEALVFTRRPRSQKEPTAVLVHRLVRDGAAVSFAGYETDRREFFGRGGSVRAPRSLSGGRRARHGRLGAVIDPVMSLSAAALLPAKGSVTFALVTAVGRSRSAAVALAAQYGSMHAVHWAFRDAEQEAPRRLARAGIDPALLPSVQRLLSALLFADPTFRAFDGAPPTGELAPRKRALWGLGISGDLPILMIRVGDAGALLLREAVLAQRYLRSAGVALDLVLLDEEPSAYLSEGSGSLRSTLLGLNLGEWINKRGGVHAIPVDRLGEDERRRLVATARVALDTRNGTLAEQLARPRASAPQLPRFEPTLVEETAATAIPAPRLRFDNGKGGFSDDGREYVIRVRPGEPTPAPWCNVLANPQFGCLTSESSLGSTWSLNAGENRLTPWRNDPVLDTPSEVLYLRDEETAAVWSPTPLPAGGEAETIVRHGAGYTSFQRASHGLEQELTILVPPESPLKLVCLRVKNKLARHRRLTATYYAEWVLGPRREESRAYVASELDRGNACLLATCDWGTELTGRVAFLAAELDLHGFTTDRTGFIGRPGDLASPEAMSRWGLSGRLEPGADPCAALQVHLELDAAGGAHDVVETHFVLGQAASRAEALALVERYRTRAAVDESRRALTAFWDGLLGCVRVQTPEPAMDLLLNQWLLYQCVASRLFARTALYQSSGAFGYRDQLQDVLALVHAAPARTRAHILEAAGHQFEEGDVLHWWHPPLGRGIRTRCSDDLVWLPYVTASYVAATGDTAILAERVPFLAAEPLRSDEHDRYGEFAVSPQVETILEHCRRALHRATTKGVHGLPLMGDCDWNDGMNLVGAKGRGESVWLGWFLCATMDRFAVLCERAGPGASVDEATEWRGRARSLRAAIEASAWDGAWYLRAFHDDGSVLGSRTAQECKIDSIAQSWAVLSAATADERARQALRSADEWLVREKERLVLLLQPPFDLTPHDPGYIRSYPPGVRENGGQYTHAATWVGWAYAALGDGHDAARIFRLLNPILRTQTAEEVELYRVEPYVLAADIYGSPPWVGRGGWTWYSGAAGWAYRLGVEAILGLQQVEGHLCVDPCIPPDWAGFQAWVRIGTEQVHVVVENPDGVSRGVARVTLDGSRLASNRVSLDLVTPPESGPR